MQRSGENQGVRPPLPPFDEKSPRQKVKMAQDAWNTRDPEKVSLAYTEDSKWQPRRVLRGPRGNQSFLEAQVGSRARLPTREEPLMLHGEPHSGKVRVRVTRQGWAMVA